MKLNFSLLVVLLLASSSSRAAGHWQPLWDGKTFNGWHIIGKGEWKIEDGAIHGTHAKTEKEFGHLVTDKSYKDFTVRMKFKALKGNSGLYFRIEEKGASGVSGFQAEIDEAKDVGGLYETNGRAWVVQPKPEDVQKWFKPGEWNDMTVSAHGGHIIVHVNGHQAAQRAGSPCRFTADWIATFGSGTWKFQSIESPARPGTI
jgi:hypothetical protein